mmetsp:Transcript_39878/g.127798  ORF Transcript_39878/g.127798 Transcript_39878/m.127798 type:complete len:308 (+) Transcript_39878:1455-2378(+)
MERASLGFGPQALDELVQRWGGGRSLAVPDQNERQQTSGPFQRQLNPSQRRYPRRLGIRHGVVVERQHDTLESAEDLLHRRHALDERWVNRGAVRERNHFPLETLRGEEAEDGPRGVASRGPHGELASCSVPCDELFPVHLGGRLPGGPPPDRQLGDRGVQAVVVLAGCIRIYLTSSTASAAPLSAARLASGCRTHPWAPRCGGTSARRAICGRDGGPSGPQHRSQPPAPPATAAVAASCGVESQQQSGRSRHAEAEAAEPRGGSAAALLPCPALPAALSHQRGRRPQGRRPPDHQKRHGAVPPMCV